jgi:hypothetical protein
MQEELGFDLDLDGNGKTIRVSAIDPNKVIAKWNATASRDVQVMEGDFLVEVNGTRHRHAIKKEIKTALELKIGFVRAEEYNVLLDQAGPLGLTFQPWSPTADPPCHSLFIIKVDVQGQISAWNAAHKDNPDMIVTVHDRIVEVNGKRGPCQLLFDEVQRAGKCKLTLSRCPHLARRPASSSLSVFTMSSSKSLGGYGADGSAHASDATDFTDQANIANGIADAQQETTPG